MTTISDKLTSIYNAKKDIKSAITEKGKTVGDNILDYAAAIRSIEQGSGGSSSYRNWWKVYFIDYDGTVLSYQEVNDGADFVFPDAPNHEDKLMRFTGWNQTSNHTTDYDPQDIYTIVIGALYNVIDTVGNTKLMFNAHSLTMTTGFTLTSTVADGITIDWGDGTTTTSSSTDQFEYTHTYDRSYLGKDVTVEIQCADGNTYTFDKVKTELDNIMPTNVKLGKGCTSIGMYAFENCQSLQSINIPSSVTYIGVGVFNNCQSLQSINIPSSVTSIEGNTFQNCYSLKSVTIPSSVTSIGNGSFSSCYSLKSVTIPQSVRYIFFNAFDYCKSLLSVSIPQNIKNIKRNFDNCNPVIYNKYLNNGNNPNSIYNNIELESNTGSGAFCRSVIIPSSSTSIVDGAFYKCSNLQSVTIPPSVTSIADSAFNGCSSLQSVNIPSGVTSIGSNAFENCYSLQSVVIPSSVTSIGGQAFFLCYSLQSINIPSSVTSIEGNTLLGCSSLQSINIPSSVTNINYNAFQECYSLQSINIPSGVTSISDGVFWGCSSLQSINIPSGVTNIGYNAFLNCYGLQSVTIPSSVTSIGSDAFYFTNCILDFGNERTTVPTIESIYSIYYNFCIVPDALYDTWCAATNWSAITDNIIKYSDYHK